MEDPETVGLNPMTLLLVFIWAFLDCEGILQSIFLTNLEIGFKNVDIKIKEVFWTRLVNKISISFNIKCFLDF